MELQLANSYTHTHTSGQTSLQKVTFAPSGTCFLSCLPHSGHRGHRARSALRVQLWHMWSSSCQISSWTWNLRPPTREIWGGKCVLIAWNSSLPHPQSHYLSGGGADSVQGKQVSGVRHGVVLGDGHRQRTLQVLWVLINLHLTAQTGSFLWNDLTTCGFWKGWNESQIAANVKIHRTISTKLLFAKKLLKMKPSMKQKVAKSRKHWKFTVACQWAGQTNRLKSRLHLPVMVHNLSVYILCKHTPPSLSPLPINVFFFFFLSMTRFFFSDAWRFVHLWWWHYSCF